MKVSEVKAGSRRLELELTIVELEEPRTYTKRDGKEGRVMTAVGEDDTGKIKVSVWEADIPNVKVGSKIKITNGYASVFRNEVQVSAGLYGKLEVV
jgi:replication factor A1